jgi:flagellar protein FlgJ
MISSASDISSRLALDAQSVGQLRLQVKSDPVAGARAAAQQFEALFLNMMLKSMRDATPKEGLFEDSNTELYTGMLDAQLAQRMSKGRGIGLADMMLRQMRIQGVIPAENAASLDKAPAGMTERQILPPAVTRPARVSQPVSGQLLPEAPVSSMPLQATSDKEGFADAVDFVNTLWPHAAEAAQTLGIPAHFLLGHAALESGWGRREIRDAQGNNSYNLFGIKAGKGWNGAVMQAQTTEYINGAAQKKTELFRAYASYAESINDYAALLKNSPRYAPLFAQPLDAAGFARGLQQAGYATDPVYADKLARVINGGVLRQALS